MRLSKTQSSEYSPKHLRKDWIGLPSEPRTTCLASRTALGAKTETEAIERALDLAIAEHERNRFVLEATERFVKSGIDIKDMYGTLDG